MCSHMALYGPIPHNEDMIFWGHISEVFGDILWVVTVFVVIWHYNAVVRGLNSLPEKGLPLNSLCSCANGPAFFVEKKVEGILFFANKN